MNCFTGSRLWCCVTHLQGIPFKDMAEGLVGVTMPWQRSDTPAAVVSVSSFVRDSQTGQKRLNLWRLMEFGMREASASSLTNFMVHYNGSLQATRHSHRRGGCTRADVGIMLGLGNRNREIVAARCCSRVPSGR